MATTQVKAAHTGGNGLFIIGTVLYLAFIGLFLWQTAEFVNWMFPSDQIIYRVITVTTFDVMAVLWAAMDTFYRFATRSSHGLVKWAWTISFIASMVASIFYMVLQSMTRLNFTPDATWVNIGYSIVIMVTVLQILFLTFFIRQEWMARHPKMQDYEYETMKELTPVVVSPVPAPVVQPNYQLPRQARQQPIDTQKIDTGRYKALPAGQKTMKRLPPTRKFTPSTPAQGRKPSGPLAHPVPQKKQTGPVKVTKREQQYTVVKKPPILPTND